MAGKVVDVTLKLIDQISSPLNAVGNKLANSANQFVKAGKQIENAGKKITNVGSTLTKSLTMPIVGAGVACIKLASDFEAGMSKVQSISGATSDELDKLSEKAKEMGSKTKFSATEASEAFSYMAMAGWKTADMLDGIEGIMYLAGATGEDLASTSDIVTDALTAFGMSANETQRFVDVLASTASNANTNVAMLGESFKYVAPVAGSLGYNVEDISTALGLMANAGIKASSAGTSLRSFLTNMAKPTKQSSQAMEKLGISLTDSKGQMKSFDAIMQDLRKSFSKLDDAQKAEYASMLAGKTGMSGLLAIVNSSDEDFNKLAGAIYNSNDACKEMYDVANNNLTGQLTILKSTAESLAISFGERLTPYAEKLVKWLQSLADKFNGLSDAQKDTIVKIAGIVAVIGPALMVFGKLTTSVGKVVSMIGNVGKAFKLVGSVAGLATTPVGWVIGALLALVAVGVLVYKNWDKIKVYAQKVWNYVKSVFSSMGMTSDNLKKKLEPIAEKFVMIKNKIIEFWNIVKPYVMKVYEVVKDIFLVRIGAIFGGVVGYVKSMINSVSKYIDGLLTVFSGIIDFFSGVFTGNWKKAWEGIKDIFGGAFQAMKSLALMPLNAVIGIINGAIAGINKLGLKIPDWVPIVGGKEFSINIPEIPQLAVGTDNWQGGLAQISERGGEIVDLPQGSRVYPHDETVKKAYQDGARAGGMGSITIAKIADQIVVREEADIDKIAQALANKLEKVSQNLGGGQLGYIY